jgi:hypothetical protein
MSSALRREERRLHRIFRSARTIALATPVALPLACGADDGWGSAERGASASAVESRSSLGLVPASERNGEAASCAPQPYAPDPPDSCGDFMRLPCGLPAGVVPGSNCYLWLNDCKKICPEHYFNCHAVGDSCVGGNIVKDAKGGVDIDCSTCAKGVGRVPAGLAKTPPIRASSALGAYFAEAAHLEAASVHAFRRLHDELAMHGAPARLLRAARRARRDEVRHARITARIARQHGGVPVRPRVAALAPRSLEAVAIENAVEGCIRETFGAFVASFQAVNAQEPEIARVMASIARDETQHAALSWAVARWAWRRLDAGARSRLREACEAAITSLRQEADTTLASDLAGRAGLPRPHQCRAMLAALSDVWSAVRAPHGAVSASSR